MLQDREGGESGNAGARGKSWTVGGEIEWGSIDLARSRLDVEFLALARRAALRAARGTVRLSALLSLLSGDAQASALLCNHLHDSWKHFHTLRSYLDTVEFSPPISDSELERELRDAAASTARPADVATALGDLVDDAAGDGALFALICAQANETSLARLASRIGGDRNSHALSYSSLLTRPAPHIRASARIA